MSNAAAPTPAKAKGNLWMTWLATAAVAILAGVLLPHLMSGEMAIDKALPNNQTNGKDNLEYTAPSLPEAPNPQAMLLRLGIGTAVVLGLCVATLWGLRRWVHPQAAAGSGPREMKLMETLQ